MVSNPMPLRLCAIAMIVSLTLSTAFAGERVSRKNGQEVELHPDGTWTPVIKTVPVFAKGKLPAGLRFGMSAKQVLRGLPFKKRHLRTRDLDQLTFEAPFKKKSANLLGPLLSVAWSKCRFYFDVLAFDELSCSREHEKSPFKSYATLEQGLNALYGAPTHKRTVFENEKWKQAALADPAVFRQAARAGKISWDAFWRLGKIQATLSWSLGYSHLRICHVSKGSTCLGTLVEYNPYSDSEHVSRPEGLTGEEAILLETQKKPPSKP